MHDRGTVLIVDDVKENIDILLELLNKYDLIPTLEGKNAIEIAKEESNIDLILLDIMMPDIDGYEVCRLLKKDPKTAHIPIIFLSAKNKQEDIQKGFDAGGVDYITKPFNPDELLSRVSTHLKLRAYEKDLEARVQEEIQKNRVKEHIIFQKAKQAALGELLMHIAFQWKQPLVSLNSINIATKEKINSSKELDKNDFIASIDKAEDIIMFMSETIDTFKNFYQPSNENKKFSITESIIDILSIIEGTFYFDNIKIYIISHEKEQTLGSANDFSQAMLAILNNSREIFKIRNIENPEIRISIENQKITISDNGGGIEEKLLEDIFLPSLSTNNGAGIGLYLSKILIEKNNGVITASNTKEGALFNIEFLTWIE
jgi:CheY-like chemotaxis protein